MCCLHMFLQNVCFVWLRIRLIYVNDMCCILYSGVHFCCPGVRLRVQPACCLILSLGSVFSGVRLRPFTCPLSWGGLCGCPDKGCYSGHPHAWPLLDSCEDIFGIYPQESVALLDHRVYGHLIQPSTVRLCMSGAAANTTLLSRA